MEALENTPPNIGYVLDLENVRNGDIILESGYKLHSKAIQTKTKSHYSHAMIFLDGTIFEATRGGSTFTRVPNRFYVRREKDLKVIRRTDPISADSLKKMTAHARSQTACFYNITEAINSVRPKKRPNQRAPGQFCSRFVAECFYAGGIKVAKNIHYCTPADLEKLLQRESYIAIDNAVKLANPEELAHAKADTPHHKHRKATVEWTKKARSLLKSHGHIVESMGDIYQAILDLRDPRIDQKVADAMRASGYADNYNDDREANPYRYDTALFLERLSQGQTSIDSEVHKEISIYNHQMTNLIVAQNNLQRMLWPCKTLQLDYEICKCILLAVRDRLIVIENAAFAKNISSEFTDIAKKIIEKIESAI